jgi:tetratricopeptide (TPR) repeat protein
MIEYLGAKGEPRAVEEFLLENLARRKAVRDSSDPLIAQTLRLLGLHYLKQGRFAEAEERLRAAVEIFRMSFPEDHRQVARAKSELGEALLKQRRYEEAEGLLRESTASLRDHADVLPVARERLNQLYRAWGRDPR